ncbi:PD-(D/E)XK nuclease family protein, partial [Actinoplanes sp. RD1]|uniref:PD-(D/E)XK nuclease family protein n=1 Tax=Actinoplanes sp. RD1 TaxID=3064538 RepID=UPI002740E539
AAPAAGPAAAPAAGPAAAPAAGPVAGLAAGSASAAVPPPPDDIVGDHLDDATLVEAMADLGAPQQYSQEGFARLRAYSRELAELRQRLDQPLPDLVADIERTIGLDVEVAVRGWAAGDAGLARGHLDALGDVAARYAGDTDGGTLAGFLAFLDAAEEEERGLTPGQVDVVEGAVQILTAHAAKGLEWDVVSVAGLTRNVWPGMTRGSDNYLGGIGVLPFPLRGDAGGLPELDLSGAVDQKDVNAALTAFGRAWREHDEREERRLAYVAVTRPRRLLLASGYWWGDGVKRPRGPSVFLSEIRASCLEGAGLVEHWAPEPAADAVNPSAEQVASAEWPSDPLGGRRPAMAAAADLIRRMIAAPDPASPSVITAAAAAAETAAAAASETAAAADSAAADSAAADSAAADSAAAAAEFVALAASDPEVAARAGLAADLVGLPPSGADPAGPGDAAAGDAAAGDAAAGGAEPPDPDIERWRREAALLLAEREERARREGPLDVAIPSHLSVSQLVVLRRDPQLLARTLRRPLPHRPAPQARRGTAFHAWLEQRYGAVRLLDLDELPGAADDDGAADEELAALQEAFLAGEWAGRTPLEVEVPFATTVAGVVLRGRIDAVFAEPGGRYDVIDWKTGRRPATADAAAATVQLAAYRMAWATLAGVPVSRVRAGFHYVREGVTVRPADLLDADGLAALITDLPLI